MANIGSFKKVGNDFQGEIVTLSLQTKGVRIVARDQPLQRQRSQPPGLSWAGPRSGPPGRSAPNEGRDYLSLKLDDPSFNAPIYANLFDDEDGEGYTLIWSRPRKRNGD